MAVKKGRIESYILNCLHPFQDDHIFVSCDLDHHIKASDVLINELTRRVSDHIPLVVELDLRQN